MQDKNVPEEGNPVHGLSILDCGQVSIFLVSYRYTDAHNTAQLYRGISPILGWVVEGELNGETIARALRSAISANFPWLGGRLSKTGKQGVIGQLVSSIKVN